MVGQPTDLFGNLNFTFQLRSVGNRRNGPPGNSSIKYLKYVVCIKTWKAGFPGLFCVSILKNP